MINITNSANENKHQYHLNNKMMPMQVEKKGRKIYLVDDDYDDLIFSSKALLHSDIVEDVYIVETANKFFESMKEHGYFDDITLSRADQPIILMDVHMPSINGIELLERLKDHPMTCDFPVIMLTSDLSGTTIHDAYRLQADGYLQKPFDLNEFQAVLAAIEHHERHLKIDGYIFT